MALNYQIDERNRDVIKTNNLNMSGQAWRFKFKRFMRTPIVYFGLGVAGFTFWWTTYATANNIQTSHTSLFKGIMFFLRHNPQALELLGPNISYQDFKHPRIKGHIGTIKGIADVEFIVEGEKGQGKVHFKGNRVPGGDGWKSSIFTLKKDNHVINYH